MEKYFLNKIKVGKSFSVTLLLSAVEIAKKKATEFVLCIFYWTFVKEVGVRRRVRLLEFLFLLHVHLVVFNLSLTELKNYINMPFFQFVYLVVVHMELHALQSACVVLVRENKVCNMLLYSLTVFCTNSTLS